MISSHLGHPAEPIGIDGRTASTLLGEAKSLAAELVSHFATNVAPCQTLPGEEIRGDVTAITRACLTLAMQMLDQRTPPTEEQLAGVRESAAQWAREGVPLETIVQTYYEGFRIGFDLVVGHVTAADLPDLIAATRLVLRLLEAINTAVAAAYTAEQRDVAREHQTVAQTLVSALLSGHGVAALTRQTGIEVAEHYEVVALLIPPHADERHPRVDTQVAARRKLRRLQAALADAFGSRSLALLGAHGGTLLIPVAEPGSPALTDAVLARLGAAAQVELTATVVTARTEQIPVAAEDAHELLDLVTGIGRPAGAYRLADLAIEYQLTRPGPARDQLVRVLAPLAEYPELLDTLRTYLETGLNRKATGRRMHVHPNTVDYRLRRIATITALDMTTAEGILRARIALLAGDLPHYRRAC
ncbi:helix-turn-helix domain-containing protein [Nocardia sp. NPDC050712]|uniref:PucR family transcriptional regulator n=1 Tax=Nocardia sp. NPDC050712 TaxID=3155518 RepID=UPI0033C9E8D3